MKKYLFLFLVLFTITSFGQVEDSLKTTKSLVKMNNGSTRIGVILNDDGREVLIQDESIGKIYIRKDQIAMIRELNEEDYQDLKSEKEAFEEGEIYSNPFTTRYSFTTNALALRKGEHYAMINLYGPEVHFSLNEKLSLGVMTTWIGSPFALAAKYTIPTSNENINLGIGTLMGNGGYLSLNSFGGLHWGMVTFGDRTKNVTLSGGITYFGGDIGNSYYLYTPGTYVNLSPIGNSVSARNTFGAFGVAGIFRITEKASIFYDAMGFFGGKRPTQTYDTYFDPVTGDYITEIGPVTYNEGRYLIFLMPGVRFQTKPDRAFQVSVAGAFNDNVQFGFPMCSWFFKF